MFRSAEAAAAAAVSFLAAAIVSAYLGDAAGLSLHPVPVLLIALAAGVFPWLNVRSELRRSQDATVFSIMTVSLFTGLMWIGRPDFLPLGRGTDLTHHLLLIDYIERTGHLVHDRALGTYLGEMIDYTPGLHVLSVLVGRWSRTDGLHAIYLVVAVCVALKAGFVFLVARRYTQERAIALVAVVLLFLPATYFLGSFLQHSFLAQVVAELFAVAMWWAVVVWEYRRSWAAATIFGLSGAAAFLTWPVWIGPPLLLFAYVAWTRRPRDRRTVRHLAIGVVPIVLVAALHTVRRPAAAAIASTSGFVVPPTPASVGWLFIAVALVGTTVAALDRATRSLAVLVAIIGVQAMVLFAAASRSGAATPYLALKMFYLAIYPLAVAGAIALHSAEAFALRLRGHSRGLEREGFSRAIRWLLVAILGVFEARSIAKLPKSTPPITNALVEAGRWARGHVEAECVDYLTSNDDSAYWLHLVALGNPRSSARALDPDTFDPQKAVVRWILPGGLPYAITDGFDTLPKDIRANVDVLARFGPAAVVKRVGKSNCEMKPQSSQKPQK